MDSKLIILGAGIMQGPAIRFAKEQGLCTIVADGDPTAPCASLADRFERIDLKDKEGMEALARGIQKEGGLGGIMTAGTDFSATVAWVAERLGLPGISYETALNATDKERMRKRFKEAGVPSPDFIVLSSEPARDFVLPFPYPVVIKPVDNMGSRGCRRADDPEALRLAVIDALRYSRSGRVIVEEYMEGPEYSIDALVYKGELIPCGLADRHIFFPPYFIEMGHTIPSSVDFRDASRIISTFSQGVRALGIDHGAAKGDVKLTPSGPMIGEIAARLSGGYMSGWTYPYASGVEVTRGAIALALGKAPGSMAPRLAQTCAERAFISIPGMVEACIGLEVAQGMPGVMNLFLRIGKGDRVCFPENNVTKCGNIIALGDTREKAITAAEDAVRSVLIRLSVPNAQTEAFLNASGTLFPPDAYTLPGKLKFILQKLPDPEQKISSERDPRSIRLLPFAELLQSDSRDYVGRTVQEGLEAVRRVTGLPLSLCEVSKDNSGMLLGRSFWKAFVRGGYQGAAYLVDCIRSGTSLEA